MALPRARSADPCTRLTRIKGATLHYLYRAALALPPPEEAALRLRVSAAFLAAADFAPPPRLAVNTQRSCQCCAPLHLLLLTTPSPWHRKHVLHF